MRLVRHITPAVTLALALSVALSVGAGVVSASAGTAPEAARAAHPAYVRAVDSRHDVRFIDEGFHTPHVHVVPGRRDGDITAVGVRQRMHAVVLRLSVARLPKPAKNQFLLTPVFRIVTDLPEYEAFVLSLGQFPQGAVELESRTDFVDCPGLQLRIRYAAGVVAVTIPRSCIGNPRFVRVEAATVYPFAQSFERSYIDLAPGAGLKGGHLSHRAYAPAGASLRVTRPLLQKGHPSLDPRVARVLRTIGFLPS